MNGPRVKVYTLAWPMRDSDATSRERVKGKWLAACRTGPLCGFVSIGLPSAAEANDAARAHLRDAHGVGADGIGWPR